MTANELRDMPIKNITVSDGCDFLSGHSGSSHNNPILYASGDGFTVTAWGVNLKFGLDCLNEAFAAYRAALAGNRYEAYRDAAKQPPTADTPR